MAKRKSTRRNTRTANRRLRSRSRNNIARSRRRTRRPIVWRVSGHYVPDTVKRSVHYGSKHQVTQVKEQSVQTVQKKYKSVLLTPQEDKRIKICKRRHQRKQIIHAVGKAGRGGQKQPNQHWRDIKC